MSDVLNFNRRQPRQAIHDVGCQDGHSSSIAAVVVLVNKKEVSDRLARKQIALRASVRGVTGRMLGRRCGPSACKSRAPMRVSALFASRVPERQLSSGRAGLRTLRKGGRRGRARRSRAVGSAGRAESREKFGLWSKEEVLAWAESGDLARNAVSFAIVDGTDLKWLTADGLNTLHLHLRVRLRVR